MGTDQCQAERSRRLQCSHLPVRLGKVGDGQPLEFVGEEPALLGGELVNSAHTELQSDRGRCAHQFLVEPPQRAHTHVDSRCPHCRDLFGPVSRHRDGPVALAHQPVAPCPARKGTIPFAYPMARGGAGQDTGPLLSADLGLRLVLGPGVQAAQLREAHPDAVVPDQASIRIRAEVAAVLVASAGVRDREPAPAPDGRDRGRRCPGAG